MTTVEILRRYPAIPSDANVDVFVEPLSLVCRPLESCRSADAPEQRRLDDRLFELDRLYRRIWQLEQWLKASEDRWRRTVIREAETWQAVLSSLSPEALAQVNDVAERIGDSEMQRCPATDPS